MSAVASLPQLALFAAEALILSAMVLGLFRLRRWLGLCPLYIGLGVLQPIQVQFASSVYAEILPGLVVSPGSAVFFTCSMFAVLLVYIREDADEARKLIYGLVVANLTVGLLFAITQLHLGLPATLNLRDIPREFFAQDARVMVAGTLALYADAILLVLAYEAMRSGPVRAVPFLRIFLALSAALLFDSVAFSVVGFAGTPLFSQVLVAGAAGKLLFAALYAGILSVYLARFATLAGTTPFRDVFHALTYRERYEHSRRALDRSAARQRAILEAATDAIFALDARGAVVEANAAAARIFGRDRAELAAGSFADRLLAPESRAEFAARLGAAALETGPPGEPNAPLQATALRGDGESFPAEISLAHADLDGAPAAVVSLRDISERLRMIEHSIQAQKLESVGRLAGGVAHDFNNLLTVILGQAEMLRDRIAGASAGREHADAILDAAERAARLTRQLLAFSRRQTLRRRVVDLNDVVRGLEDMLRRLIGEDSRLEIRLAPDVHAVSAAPDQLEQVIVNLVVNARDAQPEGGPILLETRNVDGAGHPDLEHGPYACCSVTDEGPGMPAAVRKHAFEPFFTTKPPGQGTGLGLATCLGIVKQFDGHIEIESAEGRGTTVRFFLPRTGEAESFPAEERRAARAIGPGRGTVLVVEDDSSVRNFLAASLASLGYDVLAEATADRAFRFLEPGARKLDLVVTDVVLPDMRGDRFVARVRGALGPVPAVYVSGYPRDPKLLDLSDPGSEFLQKPFTVDQLAESVARLLRAARAGNPASL